MSQIFSMRISTTSLESCSPLRRRWFAPSAMMESGFSERRWPYSSLWLFRSTASAGYRSGLTADSVPDFFSTR